MFTKEQRQTLNAYSIQLYGSASRWVKELERGQFNIPTGTREVKDEVQTVQFPRTKKGRPGQIMSRTKALAKGLIKEEQVPLERTRQVQEFRDPTYDDLVKAFEQMVDSQKIGRLSNDKLIQVLAYRYVAGGLQFNISLVTQDGEQYAKDLTDSLKFAPEVHRQALTDRIATAEKPADGLPVDAVQFLTDVTFAANSPEAAKELAEGSLADVDLTPQKSKIPYQFAQLQMGVAAQNVNPKIVAARRAKNKAARAARRRNRAS
jgi:hypothetical protein